jgi:tetratricopeptide (TPR) repeat protein
MSGYPTLSVCMIVKNEEANLPRLLGSVRGLADEVVLVDTGSTDRTVEIAESFGAHIHHFRWCDDFSAARNVSLTHAEKDYILWLDGDDEIEQSEHGKIKAHLKKHFGSAAYVKLRNAHSTEETESIQLRIIPNHRGIAFTGRVHEQLFFSVNEKKIPFTNCDAVIIHHGYEEEGETKRKLSRNRRIHEQEMQADPDNIYPHFYLARTLKGLDEHEPALRSYLRFVEMGKDRPEIKALDIYKIALFEAALTHMALGQQDEAMALLENSRKLFPAFRLFNFFLGQLYCNLGDYERAYEELLPLKGYRFESECLPVEVAKSVMVLHKLLGISSIFTRDYRVATECLRAVVASDPKSKENYHYLALALEKKGDTEGAVEVCTEGLRALGDDGFLRKRRFLLLVQRGETDRALSEYEHLNGCGRDVDVLCAMFSIHSKALNATGMNHYYTIVQEELSLGRQIFPEGLESVRAALAAAGENLAVEFFDGAISSLLNN